MVGHAVRQVRRERGVSQERLAFASGLDRTFISALERGVHNPSLLSVFALAEALNVDIRDFFAPNPADRDSSTAPQLR
jgi:transcriptional regulator with XRE-family HTH domain